MYPISFLKYHANAYDDEEELLRAKGLDCQCLGGGRILHEPDKKYIKVYGYSMGFGKKRIRCEKELRFTFISCSFKIGQKGCIHKIYV